uniref:IF rod domain-containing protein n=1 Tax=Glossina brevipalpis TaxID=37001 RepID=A0A1A9WEQ9_9MUSC
MSPSESHDLLVVVVVVKNLDHTYKVYFYLPFFVQKIDKKRYRVHEFMEIYFLARRRYYTTEPQSSRDTMTAEDTNVKTTYANELNNAPRLLDDTTREKTTLEIDLKRLREENEELKAKLNKKSNEFNAIETKIRMYQLLATDWSTKYNAIDDDRKKVVAELRQLQREIDNHLNETRRRLEVEILSEMDLEYYTQSLREELTLKDELHVQEINEIRLRHLDEINEIDGRISAQYEEKLHRSLERVRNQYETLMRAKRDEIALMYQQKFEKLLRKIANQANANANVVNKLRGARKRIKVVNKRILKLKSNKAFLNSQIKALKTLRFRYWANVTTFGAMN